MCMCVQMRDRVFSILQFTKDECFFLLFHNVFNSINDDHNIQYFFILLHFIEKTS